MLKPPVQPVQPRVRHDRVEDLAIDVVVVAAEGLAGAPASLDNYDVCRQIEEIQGVRVGLWKSWIVHDLSLQEMLNGRIARAAGWSGIGKRGCAHEGAMADRAVWDIVFR
jgi:hypothetical protein